MLSWLNLHLFLGFFRLYFELNFSHCALIRLLVIDTLDLLDQNSKISCNTISQSNLLEAIPFVVVHIYISSIWDYPPPPPASLGHKTGTLGGALLTHSYSVTGPVQLGIVHKSVNTH